MSSQTHDHSATRTRSRPGIPDFGPPPVPFKQDYQDENDFYTEANQVYYVPGPGDEEDEEYSQNDSTANYSADDASMSWMLYVMEHDLAGDPDVAVRFREFLDMKLFLEKKRALPEFRGKNVDVCRSPLISVTVERN